MASFSWFSGSREASVEYSDFFSLALICDQPS
jgi:hypothetical protein